MFVVCLQTCLLQIDSDSDSHSPFRVWSFLLFAATSWPYVSNQAGLQTDQLAHIICALVHKWSLFVEGCVVQPQYYCSKHKQTCLSSFFHWDYLGWYLYKKSLIKGTAVVRKEQALEFSLIPPSFLLWILNRWPFGHKPASQFNLSQI